MFPEESALIRENASLVNLYRYNLIHLPPKLNGYGDRGAENVVLLRFYVQYMFKNGMLCVHCASLYLSQEPSEARLRGLKITKSMMKIGNVTLMPSVF